MACMPRGTGAPVWITGPDARAHGHLLRARHDAILVGRGTILADNPSLTCRLPGMSCRSPVRVVLDRRLRTPPQARLFDDLMVPVWVICAADEEHPNTDALQDRGAEIVQVPVDAHGMLGVRDALETLASRGITRVLVEGGPTVARAFLDADLIDEAVIFQGVKRVGEDGLMPFVTEGLDRVTSSGHFTQVEARSFGPDRMTALAASANMFTGIVSGIGTLHAAGGRAIGDRRAPISAAASTRAPRSPVTAAA